MHLDISSTQLLKEEVLFIAQNLKDNTRLVSIHLSGNYLDNYSRTYLRTYLNASFQPNIESTKDNRKLTMKEKTEVFKLTQYLAANYDLEYQQN